MKTPITAITITILGLWLTKLYFNNDLALLILPRYNILILISAIILTLSGIAIFLYRKHEWHEIQHHTKAIHLVIIATMLVVELNTTLGLTSNSVSQRGQTDIANVKLQTEFDIAIPSNERSFGDWIHILKDEELTEQEQGKEVSISGFAYNDPEQKNTILLSRFLIRCCAADAQFVSLPIKSTQQFPNDQWLQIEGIIKGTQIEAKKITQIKTPKIQYIN